MIVNKNITSLMILLIYFSYYVLLKCCIIIIKNINIGICGGFMELKSTDIVTKLDWGKKYLTVGDLQEFANAKDNFGRLGVQIKLFFSGKGVLSNKEGELYAKICNFEIAMKKTDIAKSALTNTNPSTREEYKSRNTKIGYSSTSSLSSSQIWKESHSKPEDINISVEGAEALHEERTSFNGLTQPQIVSIILRDEEPGEFVFLEGDDKDEDIVKVAYVDKNKEIKYLDLKIVEKDEKEREKIVKDLMNKMKKEWLT
jgi:hypothetical protein